MTEKNSSLVALVTGSSRGIGAALKHMLEERGVTVIGHATRPGSNAIAADFSDPPAPQMLWEAALKQAGGRIDILVNNAGYFAANPIGSSDIAWLDGWEDTLRINLTAAAQLSRFAIRHWLERGDLADGGERIIHIASRAAHRGDSPDHWHYAAAKGGMLALHKTIARAYAKNGIFSFAVAPGFTNTAAGSGGVDEYLASRGGPDLLAQIPLGRVATPQEIATIAAFCALDAPPSMTGAVIDANGASHVR